jgi:hypothetical protein
LAFKRLFGTAAPMPAAPDPDWRSMSILTERELEFLAGLRTSWRMLYWSEFVRLLNENDNRGDTRHETPSAAPPSGRSKGFVPS